MIGFRDDFYQKINNNQWQFGSTNIDDDFHTDYIFLDVATNSIQKYIGIKHTKCLLFYEKFTGSFYFDKEENQAICNYLIRKLITDSKFNNNFENLAIRKIEKMERYWNHIFLTDVMSSKKILKIYKNQLDIQKDLYIHTWFMEILTNEMNGIESHLKIELSTCLTVQEIDQLIQYCISGKSISIYSQFENEIVLLAKKLKKIDFLCCKNESHLMTIIDYDSRKMIDEIHKKFKYLHYHGFSSRETFTKYDILKMAYTKLINNDFRLIDSCSNIDSLFLKIKNKELIILINALAKFSSLKAKRRLAQLKNFYFLDILLWKISTKYMIDEIVLRFMMPAEVISLIKKKILPAQLSNIKDRYKGMIYLRDGNNEAVYTDSSYIRSFNVTKKDGASGKYFGKIACPGLAQGIARKITRFSSQILFEKGDILLCLEGDPDLLPYIKIAGAVIAEQGGVTCHVAVVAREFNIPCIMGVGAFLKDFIDGDYVYVNATEGYFYKGEENECSFSPDC